MTAKIDGANLIDQAGRRVGVKVSASTRRYQGRRIEYWRASVDGCELRGYSMSGAERVVLDRYR